MPRDISGNYTLPAGNPVVTNTLISSVWGNTTLSDIGSALTNSLDRTGVSAGMTGQFKAAAGAVGAPGISWQLETTSGFYRIGAGDFGFSIAGTKYAEFKASLFNFLVNIASFGGPGTGFFVNPNFSFEQAGTVNVGIRDTTDSVEGLLRADSSGVIFGASTNHSLNIRTNNTNRVAVAAAGNVTINAPSAGTALTINGFAGQVPLAVTADNTGNWSATFTSTSATESRAAIAFVNNRTTSQTWAVGQNPDGGTDKSFSIRDATRNAVPFNISNTGNVTINAPSSGNALVVSGFAGQYVARFTASSTVGSSFGPQVLAGTNATDQALYVLNQAGTIQYFLISGDGSGGLGPSATKGLSWIAAGNVTLASPSSGDALTVTSGSTANVMLALSGASGTRSIIGMGRTAREVYFGISGSAGGIVTGDAAADFSLGTTTGNINLSANNGTSIQFKLTTAGDILARGVAICKSKAATTSRNTTIVPANDPDLTYAIPAAGTYAIEILLSVWGTTTGTQGIQTNVNYSGTFTATSGGISRDGTNNGASVGSGGYFAIAATVASTSGPNIVTITTVSGQGDVMRYIGMLVATGAGTLALSWSQNSSSGNNTNVGAGSYMKVTQLS